MKFDLFKLHTKKDVNPKSWICVEGNGLKEELYNILNEITTTKITKTKIFELIAEKLNCPVSNIKRRIYCRNKFPLIMILELLNIWKNKLNKSEEEFFNKKQQIQDMFEYLKCNASLAKPVKSVKLLSIRLSKICGAHAADGWLTERKRKNGFITYDYTLRDEDEKAVIAFQRWILKEFGFETKINNRYAGCYSIEFSNKIFVRYLHTFFKFPYGKKTYLVKEPEMIKNSDFRFRKAFAFGVMTFDGAVCKSKRIELLICSKDLRDSIFNIVSLDGIKNITSTEKPDKYNRWHFYASRALKNPEYDIWLDYFETDTNKYKRVLSIIKERNSKCYGRPI